LFEEQKYLLQYNPQLNKILVVLHKSASDYDVFKSYWHASVIKSTLENKLNIVAELTPFKSKINSTDLVKQSFLSTQHTFDNFMKDLQKSGWNINNNLLSSQLWRVSWNEKNK
jgi:hypothetical protein